MGSGLWSGSGVDSGSGDDSGSGYEDSGMGSGLDSGMEILDCGDVRDKCDFSCCSDGPCSDQCANSNLLGQCCPPGSGGDSGMGSGLWSGSGDDSGSGYEDSGMGSGLDSGMEILDCG